MNLADPDGSTAAHHAAASPAGAVALGALLLGGAALSARDMNVWTPLHKAAWAGHTSCVHAILSFHAGQTAAIALEKRLRQAGRSTELEVRAAASAPLERGAGGDGAQLWERATVEADEAFLKADGWASGWAGLVGRRGWLVGQGVLVRDNHFLLSSADRWSRTPLSWALLNDRAAVVAVLLRAGAGLDWSNPHTTAKQRRANNFWSTSLHLALTAAANSTAADPTCRFRVLRLLLAEPSVGPAELAKPDADGEAATHIAARLVFPDLLPPVRSGGEGGTGRQPVDIGLAAAAGGLQMLLVAGAEPDGLDEQGRAPLHHAAAAGQLGAVELLLAAGADPTRRDKAGLTPADAAAAVINADLPAGAAPACIPNSESELRTELEPETEPEPQPEPAAAPPVKRSAALEELSGRLAELLRVYAQRGPINASILSARYAKMYGAKLNPADVTAPAMLAQCRMRLCRYFLVVSVVGASSLIWVIAGSLQHGYPRMAELLAALPDVCAIRNEPPKGPRQTAPKLLVQLAEAAGGAPMPASASKAAGAASAAAAAASAGPAWAQRGECRRRAAARISGRSS